MTSHIKLFKRDSVEQISEISEETIVKPFDPSQIDIQMKPMTLDLLIKRLRENEINMFTEFQRKGDLWDTVKQSRLIESILIRIPLPAFYFDGTDENVWLIIDGLQRLTSLKKFTVEKTLTLRNLEYLTQYNGCGFEDLPRSMQRRIEETQVAVFIINPGTPPEVKYNIFKRINTGGLTLEAQEIRHALNQGFPANFLKELAELPEFTNLISYAIKTDRMEDREFVLRFLAFNLYPYTLYTPELDAFLNNAMRALNTISTRERSDLKQRFTTALRAAYHIFGKYAFRKQYKKNGKRNPINKALFETWAVNLGQLNQNQIGILIKEKELVNEKFIELMHDEHFERSVTSSTGDRKAVKERFWRIEELIDEVLKCSNV